ncbi:MAG: hypothetical protein Salg2KO_09270 [Salibacteraceae bacterium]
MSGLNEDTVFLKPFPRGNTPIHKTKNGKYIIPLIGSLALYSKDSEVVFSAIDYELTLGFLEDSEGNIWIGSLNNGVYKYPQGDLSQRPIQYLKDLSVTSILQDVQGGLWFSTLEDGIYYTSTLDVEGISNVQGIQLKDPLIHLKNDQIIVLNERTEDGFVLEPASYREKLENTFKIPTGFKAIQFFNDDIVFRMRRENGIIIRNTNTNSNRVIPMQLQSCSSSNHGFVGSDVLSNKRLTLYFNPLDANDTLSIPWDYGRVRTLFKTNSDGLVLVSALGDVLLMPKIGSTPIVLNKNQFANMLPLHVVSFKNKTSILHSSDDKIHLLKNDSIAATSILFSASEISINDLIYDENDDKIFILTNSGIWTISDFGDTPKLFANKDCGLLSNNVHQMIFDKEIIYVSTDAGINILKSDLYPIQWPAPNISHVMITLNDRELSAFTKINLDYQFGVLKIKPSAYSYQNAFHIPYQFRIDENQEWTRMSGREIVLAAIEDGRHSLEIKAANAYGQWGESYFIELNVSPPFWRSLWFILGSFILLATISGAILSLRFRYLKRLLSLQHNLNKAQNQALAAQLNPHFVYNSMNSLISFIAKGEKKKSIYYLTKLAVLMRSIFESSEKSFISINSELRAIREYISLEKLRFNFDYSIHVQENLPCLLLPPSLIQPLIENAILHGIRDREKGNIRIKVFTEGTKVIIEVDDDGTKPIDWKFIENNNQRMSSLKLIASRLSIIKEVEGLDIGFSLEPINEAEYKTRAKLVMPIIHC